MAALETTSNGSSAGFKVNEIRCANDDDFEHFISLVEEYKTEGTGWTKKLEKKGITIWQKETGQSPIKMALIIGEFEGVSPNAVLDAILDGEYRRTWDENVIEDYEICRLDDNNDVGYYSMKCPGPLKNRDFVNQRSWKMYGSSQAVIFNHSVTLKDLPPKKKFIRALSYLTGFLIQSMENGGSCVRYITQTDIKGNIPSWIINLTINSIAPLAFKKFYLAASKYESWKSENKPDYKPWRNPEQNTLKIMDPSSLQDPTDILNVECPDGSSSQVEEEEETLPEEENAELADQITESLGQQVLSEQQITNGH